MNRRRTLTALAGLCVAPFAPAQPKLPVMTIRCSKTVWRELFKMSREQIVDGVRFAVKWEEADFSGTTILAATSYETRALSVNSSP